MAVYVYYQGRLIAKCYKPAPPGHARSELSAPAVRFFEAFSSPIDGRMIRSRREHDLDLANSGSYDPRDTPEDFKRAQDARYRQQRRKPGATEP